MSKRDDSVYINDILDSINQIFSYVGEKTNFEFSKDLLVQDAVIRRFEIIGEAASKVSMECKFKHATIEWGLMKDMRNKLIHEYFGVSTKTIYETIHRYLPVLKEKLEAIQ
jgi:uncharacterized protein with HEPN domain